VPDPSSVRGHGVARVRPVWRAALAAPAACLAAQQSLGARLPMAWRAGLGTVSAARVRGLDVRLPTARSARARAARPGQEGARGPLVGAAGRRGGPARARGPPRFVASAARAAAEPGAVRLGPEARTTEFGQEVWLATGLVGAAAVPHTYFRRRALSAFSSARLQDGDGLVWYAHLQDGSEIVVLVSCVCLFMNKRFEHQNESISHLLTLSSVELVLITC